MKHRSSITYILLALLGILLYAFADPGRGYDATGGEVLLLVLPIGTYEFVRVVWQWVRECWKEAGK